MANRYGDYSPLGQFAGGLGSGLSEVLGGYLGAKLEQDKQRRHSEGQALVLKKRYPDMTAEEREETSQLDPRGFSYLLNTLDQQKERAQETQSLGNLAERTGVDRTQLEGMDPREQISFINEQRREKQTLKDIARIREQKEDMEIEQQLVEEGYSPSQIKKAKAYGKFSEKEFRKKHIRKGLTLQLQRLREIRKGVIAGKVSKEQLVKLDDSQRAILAGQRMMPSQNDPITSFFRAEATKKLGKSQKFLKYSINKQIKEIAKLSRKYAKSFGYQFDKPKGGYRAGVRQPRQPGLLSRAGSALGRAASTAGSAIVGGLQGAYPNLETGNFGLKSLLDQLY